MFKNNVAFKSGCWITISFFQYLLPLPEYVYLSVDGDSIPKIFSGVLYSYLSYLVGQVSNIRQVCLILFLF